MKKNHHLLFFFLKSVSTSESILLRCLSLMLIDDTSLFSNDSLSSLSTSDECIDSFEPNLSFVAFSAKGFFFFLMLDSPLYTLETMISEPISEDMFLRRSKLMFLGASLLTFSNSMLISLS